MRTLRFVWLIVMVTLLPLAGVAAAQEKAQPKGWVAAQVLFEKNCSKCHVNGKAMGDK
jgi:mono/diheme cytochrome c family protein